MGGWWNKRKMLYLQLTEEMKNWLRKKAKDRGNIGMSAMVRMLIAKEMKNKNE